jgi:hypothetical protein
MCQLKCKRQWLRVTGLTERSDVIPSLIIVLRMGPTSEQVLVSNIILLEIRMISTARNLLAQRKCSTLPAQDRFEENWAHRVRKRVLYNTHN